MFNVRLIVTERPAIFRRDLEKVMELFAEGKLHYALPLKIHDISHIKHMYEEAHRGKNVDKYVFKVSPESEVEATIDNRPTFKMNQNETFVIAGGLGGIGRASVGWMAARGTKNLVLLSRFGPRTDPGIKLIEELKVMGVRVETPACDVTDINAMRAVFNKLMPEMPPIKGVIQASIIARANYDAGNTYEDAIARYRVSIGEKAVSFDLGAMADDGILAEDKALLSRVHGYGALDLIKRETFYGMLDYYCNPDLPLLTLRESQLAFGLGTAGGDALESLDHARQPMLQPLVPEGQRRSTKTETGTRTTNMKNIERFRASESLENAAELFAEAAIGKLAKSLATMQDGASVDRNKPLQAYGVDSLLAIELRNWVFREFNADVAVFETQGSSTLGTLSMLVAGRSTIKHEKWSIME
ncbi:KR domain-containing protein [Aspergillus flavus]|uniref:KR domain-containing protein n=1 Tax=Aspergillus flavus TaxID=5059 RepID=A0A5N6H7T7_ASPFL|nr:KR domain-containing protein [Aspergillus flavus]